MNIPPLLTLLEQRAVGDLETLKRGNKKVEINLRESYYNEGWDDCIDHLAQRGMLNCGWLPADEAPYDTMCLFYTKDGHVVQGFIYDGGAEDYGYSHYMPLPAAPKMEGE